MKARTILQGCGAGVLFAFPYVWQMLSPDHIIFYHSDSPATSIVWARLIDFGIVIVTATLLFACLEWKNAAHALSLVWALVAAKLASLLLYLFPVVTGRSMTYWGTGRAFWIALSSALALRLFRPTAYRVLARGSSLVLAAAGFCAFWMLPQLMYFGLRRPVLASPLTLAAAAQRPLSPSGQRIVWLLFDELSFYQTFDHRYPGLAMPAFDRLRSESVSFENLRPAGYFTDHVVPSLFLGQVVKDIHSDLDGNLWLRTSGETRWHRFDAQATLFGDASHRGWTTGVAGWFNPYCRILAGTLDSCYSRIGTEEVDGAAAQNSLFQNVELPIEGKMRALEHRPSIAVEEHEEDFQAVMHEADALIRDETIRFLFIHLPVPHPPGIYDRQTGRIRTGGTYIDNLALADRVLEELTSSLNGTASGSNTTLIVSSDHSWRIPLWRPAPGWTKEEEAASQGKFDTRPVLLIHFPSQSAQVRIAEPFDQIHLHEILERMIHGEMHSPQEVQSSVGRMSIVGRRNETGALP
jgi:hypothetical protein